MWLFNIGGSAICIKPGVFDCDLLVGGVDIVDLYFAIVDVDAPVLDVDGMGFGEPDMAVDTTARVPTGVGLVGVVYSDCHYVLAFVDIRGYVVLETRIAIRARAYLLSIDIHGGVHVNTIEFQEGMRSLRSGRDDKGLSVPADATGQGTTTRATGVAIVEIALDGPIVGDIEGAPMRIVILRTGHLGRIAQDELPVVIKTNSLSGVRNQRAE